MPARAQSRGETVLKTCTCLAVRRASRAVSQAYDEALAPQGITSGQFTLLAQIKLRGQSTISSLARRLVMERTTLTRNLRLLQDREMVALTEGAEDKRKRLVGLTDHGEVVLARAMPYWEAAQDRLMQQLGRSGWTRALEALDRLIDDLRPKSTSKSSAPWPRVPASQETPWNAGHLAPPQIERLRGQLCLCTMLRRGARAVTKFYDDRLRPIGINVAQLHIIAAVEALPGTRVNDLIEVLTLDQTTLTRMLQRLTELEFLQRGRANDAHPGFRLIEPGRRAFALGFSGWEAAQSAGELLVAPLQAQTHSVMGSVLSACGTAPKRDQSEIRPE